MANRAHPAREVVPEERREVLTKDEQGRGILWVQVDARAVEVEDDQDGVTHLIQRLSGILESSLNDFSEDVGAYHGDFFDGLNRMKMFYYNWLEILYCAGSAFQLGGKQVGWIRLEG